MRRHLFTLGVAAALWLCNGEVSTTHVNLIATAEAVVGAPVTPVSYAGVARRSTVGVGAPGVGATPAPGVGAPGRWCDAGRRCRGTRRGSDAGAGGWHTGQPRRAGKQGRRSLKGDSRGQSAPRRNARQVAQIARLTAAAHERAAHERAAP